jgi:hypothetical protein
MPHRNDSAVQREAEALIRENVEAEVAQPLVPATVKFESGAAVQVDGVATDESVLVEIFAHQDKPTGASRRRSRSTRGSWSHSVGADQARN